MLFQAPDDAALFPGQDPGPPDEEVRSVQEERIQALNNMEELEQKIKELDNQMEESAREVKRACTKALIIHSFLPKILFLFLSPVRRAHFSDKDLVLLPE